MVGWTNNSNFPMTSDAFQSVNGAANLATTGSGSSFSMTNGFLTVLNPTLTGLVYSTYFGGTGYTYDLSGNLYYYGDTTAAVALDPGNNIYIAGVGSSGDLPILEGAYQTSKPSVEAGYVAKFSLSSSGTTVETTTTLTPSANPVTAGTSVTFSAHVVPHTGKTEPTGTVNFSVDGGSVISVALSSAGEATYSTASLVSGTHSILATYSGDSNDTVSSARLTETVSGSAPAA